MARKKVKFDFNPFQEVGLSSRKLSTVERAEVLEDVARFVEESVLDRVGSGQSPVSSEGNFAKLNKEYAGNQKGGNRLANLELDGDLLDSLTVSRMRGNKLRLTVANDQQPKADGHNNFSGASTLPKRRFVPNAADKQTFKRDIMDGIRNIIADALEGK